MRFHKEEVDSNGKIINVVRGMVKLTKEAYLEVGSVNSVFDAIYGFSEKPQEHVFSSEKFRELASKKATITIWAFAHGVWDIPETWYLEADSLKIQQEDTIIYDGDVVSGYSGDVFSKTNRMFTNMGFVERFFKEELRKALQEEVDLWILE